MFSLLPWALGLRLVDDVIGNLPIIRRSKRYFNTTITSELVLTTEELEAWNDPCTDVESRVAIFKRGLLRQNMARKVQEAA